MRRFRWIVFGVFFLGVILVQTGRVYAGALPDQETRASPAAIEDQREILRKTALVRVQTTIDTILARIAAAIGRFETLLARMESRRDAIEESFGDMTTVDSLLAVTDDHLTRIKHTREALASDASGLADQKNPRATIVRAQREIPVMVEDLHEVLGSMKDIVAELEKGEGDGRSAPSSGTASATE